MNLATVTSSHTELSYSTIKGCVQISLTEYPYKEMEISHRRREIELSPKLRLKPETHVFLSRSITHRTSAPSRDLLPSLTLSISYNATTSANMCLQGLHGVMVPVGK